MVTHLQDWLNGSRDYAIGVAFYAKNGNNKQLLGLFLEGKSNYLVNRLQSELLNIYNQLKVPDRDAEPVQAHKNVKSFIKNTIADPLNPDLFQACIEEAHKAYKKCMNLRAVLFSAVPDNLFEDLNRTDLVATRGPLALQVVKLSLKYSELYDQDDFVKINGRLPYTEKPDTADIQIINAIPDILIKQQLDNARKNFNKLKKKEPTAARIALIQERSIYIKTLEIKWLSLKQQ